MTDLWSEPQSGDDVGKEIKETDDADKTEETQEGLQFALERGQHRL